MWSKNIANLSSFTLETANLFFKQQGALPNQHSRGYKFFVEGYIHNVWFHEEDFTLRANCYHSQKRNEKPHSLWVRFKREPELAVMECHCSCEVGLSQSCHHIIGLAYYLQDLVLRGESVIPEATTSTSKPMEWNIPRGPKISPESILTTTFYKPTKVTRKKGPIRYKPVTWMRQKPSNKQLRLKRLAKQLKKVNERIPLSFLIDAENLDDTTLQLQSRTAETDNMEELSVDLPLISTCHINILISLPMPDVDHFRNFTFEDSKNIEKNTRRQCNDSEWHNKRKYIFTSSTFGLLCKRMKPIQRDFFEKLWNDKNLEHVPAIQHGRKTESNALHLYKENTKHTVYSCGLIIHPYAPYLGASPDGIIKTITGEMGVLEIKCPYGNKSGTLEAAMKMKNFHLKLDENKQYVVNPNHKYYYQVQGQMLISGLQWCDLCTYFKQSNQVNIVRVDFDPQFCHEMYTKLTDLYNVYLQL